MTQYIRVKKKKYRHGSKDTKMLLIITKSYRNKKRIKYKNTKKLN
jgi:hypothetical protein